MYRYYKNITKIALPCQLSLQIKGKKTFSRSNLCHNSRKTEGAKLQGGFDSPHITGESLSLCFSLALSVSLSLRHLNSHSLTAPSVSLFSFLLFFVILQCNKACLHVNSKCRPSILILLCWTKTCVVKIISTKASEYCVAVRVGYPHFPVL